ncbi:MAG: hypothetical protein JJE12_09835 [Anaerolineales bacterium]|nr:hypothetical protein [Anaerolineales bacterium]
MYRDGEKILHEYEPVIDFFPDLWGLVPVDREGEIITDLVTPIGKLTSSHRVIKGSLSSGVTRLNLIKHPIVDPDDFNIYQYMIEHSEFVPMYEEFFRRSEELGGSGFLVPTLNRVPFQSVLIDAMGEIACFLGLHYHPNLIDRLMAAIDQQIVVMLENLSEFDYPYIEFVDNLDGVMTNPRLFREFVLPSYQKYADILHDQGKKIGSHTDGNLKILLPLLAGCGLDVCESFTPLPLTDCSLEEALDSWETNPLIWGGIPSSILEQRVPEYEFRKYIESLLTSIKGRPIILGIADAVMTDNLIERVKWIAERVEYST